MTDSHEAFGMVDHLNSTGAGPTEAEIEFVMAYLKPGPMDPAILARLTNAELMAAREVMVAERRARDWAQLGQYRDANATLAGRPVKAVFIGDSITEFWAAADPEFFSNGVAGRGISGQTSPQILLRFMADVIALEPQVVHILCGSNDLAGNTGPSTPQDYKNNILAMLTLAQAHGIKVVIGSITPAGNFPWLAKADFDPRPRLAELNAWLKNLTVERGLVWADYHAILRADDDSMRAEYARDGVHPGAEAYALMKCVAQTSLAAALG